MTFHYNWPGNVRELRNILTRLHFLYPNTVIDQQHIYNATGEMFHLVQLEDYHSGDEMPPPTQAQAHYDQERLCPIHDSIFHCVYPGESPYSRATGGNLHSCCTILWQKSF